jgi:hypothetical protein
MIGRIVYPTNRHYASGIHDDATAQAAGFRGGTIAGSAHLDTLVPLALQVIGPDWFVGGSVSFSFRHPTTDGEPTYATLDEADAAGQHAATIVAPLSDGTEAAVGSGTLGRPGAAAPTQLRLNEPSHDMSAARILAPLSQGYQIGPSSDRVDGADLAHRCAGGLITEPIDWYINGSPWGHSIVPPSSVIDCANRVVSAQLLPLLPPAVGMWGALEVRFLHGPVFTDRTYTVTGRVVAISDSPKTEIIWQDVTLHDDDGIAVADVRIQSRFVKSTSELWKS